jgi:hypothetical protein
MDILFAHQFDGDIAVIGFAFAKKDGSHATLGNFLDQCVGTNRTQRSGIILIGWFRAVIVRFCHMLCSVKETLEIVAFLWQKKWVKG